MRRNLLLNLIIAAILLAFLTLPALGAKDNSAANDKPTSTQLDIKKITEAYDALSQARVYVEFYFMEAGDYPESLAQLEKDLNDLLPRNMAAVKIPKDPATGQEFLYAPAKDRKSYVLKVPDPSRYGLDKLEFAQVPWGGFVNIAQERKDRFLQMMAIENIKAIATAVEYFAKDHKGKIPAQLKELIPNYLDTMPVCPISGMSYIYKVEGDTYSISAPRPDSYGLKEMTFSSTRGWVTK